MKSRVPQKLLGLMITVLAFTALGLSESTQPPGRVLWQFETGG
jgi:hypothetical protein